MNRDHRTDVDQSRQERHEYNKQKAAADNDHVALIAETKRCAGSLGPQAYATSVLNRIADALSALEAENERLRIALDNLRCTLAMEESDSNAEVDMNDDVFSKVNVSALLRKIRSAAHPNC